MSGWFMKKLRVEKDLFSNNKKNKMSNTQFKNKSVVITGASSGIGRATALEFGKRGANLIVSDINEAAGKQTAQMINDAGGKAIFVKTNVADSAEVEAMIAACVEHYGSLDNIVNNAGIGLGLNFFDQITDEIWEKTIAVNQTGVFYCMRAALKIMKEQGGGNIINLASAAGIGAAPRMGAYCASKHAVVGMSKTAAAEYGKYGIRINAVCPTVINTPMGDNYMTGNEDMTKILLRSVPMRRFGEPEEVARTICWLCSTDASYLNGVALPVDGGTTA